MLGPSRTAGANQTDISQHKAGFTTVEIVLVLSLLAVLTTIAYPSVQNFRVRTKLRAAKDEVVTAHSVTRSAAARYGTVARFRIDDAQGRLWVEVDTSTTGPSVIDTVGFVVRLGLESVSLNSNRSVLCFDPRGVPAVAAGCPADGSATLILGFGGDQDTVQISALGQAVRR